MTVLIYFYIIILGLILGSFMSVIISRLDQKEGILTGRSECPKCLVRLKWYDLLPLFSFAALRGKCRYCKENISIFYPIVEISTASSFLVFYWFNSSGTYSEIFYGWVMIFILLALAFFDYQYYILPDKLIFTGLGISMMYLIFIKSDILLSSILTGFGLAGFFAIIYLVSQGKWMGFGDVKLALFVGIVLGYPMGLLSMISAIWIGAIFGIILMAIGKANLKTALPFGSFICSTAILFIIFNNHVNFLLSRI